MKFGNFIIKVDGVNDLTREIKIWDPSKEKFYDFEVWRMNNEIIIVPKLSTEEVDERLKNKDKPETEGGCHCY